jgi:hypothetical protein
MGYPRVFRCMQCLSSTTCLYMCPHTTTNMCPHTTTTNTTAMYVCLYIYIYIYIWVLIRRRCIAGMQGVTEGLSGITSAESGGIGVKSGVSGLGKVGGSLLSGLKAGPSYLSATRPKSPHKPNIEKNIFQLLTFRLLLLHCRICRMGFIGNMLCFLCFRERCARCVRRVTS